MNAAALHRHRFGVRFAYFICLSMVLAGLALQSQTILLIANGIALLGILPPRHPIDYIYNYGIRFIINRPKLPPRPAQGRFACAIAAVLLILINYFYYAGNLPLVYVFAAILVTSAVLVSFFDFCIPSLIYNALFGFKPQE